MPISLHLLLSLHLKLAPGRNLGLDQKIFPFCIELVGQTELSVNLLIGMEKCPFQLKSEALHLAVLFGHFTGSSSALGAFGSGVLGEGFSFRKRS